MRWLATTGLLLLFLMAVATPNHARVLLSQDEALRLAFGDATVERRTAYLDEDQVSEAAERAGLSVNRAVVPHYVATRDGEQIGVAYFDTHVVRTLAETVMVVVDPAGQVLRAEVIAFAEPPDYLAGDAWLRQFDGQELTDDLALRRAIRPMTGATLTARAITEAVRRSLALHSVIFAEPDADDGTARADRPEAGEKPTP